MNIADLLSPSTYPHETADIRIIETHISRVILTGPYAYKIYKPLHTSFCDFRSLAQRQQQCVAEYRANACISPDLYVGVVHFSREIVGMRIGSSAAPLETAIQMKQMPQDALMTQMLRNGQVTDEHIGHIAATITQFHRQTSLATAHDHVARVMEDWQESFVQTTEYQEHIGNHHRLARQVSQFIDHHRVLFQHRMRTHKVCVCHGDLHDGNIFIEDGKIHIFDAITFNRRFTEIDVAKDIAAFVMSLAFHGYHGFADAFVAQYLSLSRDEELPDILDFYCANQAYTRGKVQCFMQRFDTAIQYFRLTSQYLNRAMHGASTGSLYPVSQQKGAA